MDGKEYQNGANGVDTGISGQHNTTATHDHAKVSRQRKPYDYGGNPLARLDTNEDGVRLPAFGGDFQPGTYKKDTKSKLANPAPLGLCAFALTTFVLSLVNVNARDVTTPNLVVAIAFAYGGLCQLLSGMWEMAAGNTFGATALSSYGGFWIAFGIILTPGGFNIVGAYSDVGEFLNAFGFFLMGWFIFTFLMLMCTTRSTVAFFLLFFTLDLAFLMLGIGYLNHDAAGPNAGCIRAGGAFGLCAAFLAWYNALAGLLEPSNSFFLIPVAHFPWSEKGREMRGKVDNTAERLAQQV